MNKIKSVTRSLDISESFSTDLYEIISIPEKVLEDEGKMRRLELKLNVGKREGFHIYPVTNFLGEYVYYHYPDRLVICVIAGYWG